MIATRCVSVAALMLVLAGCGVFGGVAADKQPPAAVEDARPDELDRLLAFFSRARKLPAAEQAREHASVRQAFLQSQTDYNRVRLAMVLTLPGTVFSDEAQALELIDPLARNQRASLHALAVLLVTYVQEQKRLSSSVQTLQQNLQTTQQNLQTSQQNLQALQQNLQSLQQKLDALKSLDRSLIEREQGGAKKR